MMPNEGTLQHVPRSPYRYYWTVNFGDVVDGSLAAGADTDR